MVRTSSLRAFHNKVVKVVKVYNAYLDGWLDNGTVKTHRTFKYFPAHPVEVLTNGSPEMEAVSEAFKALKPGEKQELREQIWVDGKPEFHKVKDKLDRDFFKVWKKVFDLEVETENPVEVDGYNKETKQKEKVSDTKFNLTTVSASKLKNMLRSVLDDSNPEEVIPTKPGKDKAGNDAMVEEYDWEDKLKSKLEGKFVKIKVSGTGMDTTYMFQPAAPFVSKDDQIDMDSIPF